MGVVDAKAISLIIYAFSNDSLVVNLPKNQGGSAERAR